MEYIFIFNVKDGLTAMWLMYKILVVIQIAIE